MTTAPSPWTTYEGLKRLGLLPQSGERAALYRAAMRDLDLSVTDYQTIRDVIDMAHLHDDPTLEAALIALFAARNEGSLCVRADAESLVRRLPEFPGRDTLIDCFLTNLQAGAYEALIGHEESAFRPVIQLGDFLYFQRYLHDECSLRDNLQAWLAESAAGAMHDQARLHEIITEVLHAPPLSPQGIPIALNHEQQLALALALLQSFTVITGGPGTGKTSIIVAILRCLVRLGISAEHIALTAPTGRAAQRMSESLRGQLAHLSSRFTEETRLADLSGQTIHRLLGYSPSRNTFAANKDNPLAVAVVVVDEVSMIDVTLMARLLEAIPPTAKLILLGDAQQLPSVEAGAVLADLAPADHKFHYSPTMAATIKGVLSHMPALPVTSETPALLTDHVVRLVQSHRSGPGIMAVASIVNTFADDQEEALFTQLADSATCVWEDAARESTAAWWTRLAGWADQQYLDTEFRTAINTYHVPNVMTVPYDDTLADILRHLTRAKILTGIHEGRYGCDGINAFLADTVRHRLDPGCHGRYFAGAPLMVTRNDYTLDLFNGDTGIVLHDTAGGYHVAFPRGEDVLLVPLDSLPEHTLAFAITVHKSQGSEYDHVLLVLPNTESSTARRLLTREIIYTGLTRAKQTATIHGTREAFLQACRSRVQRESGLAWWDYTPTVVPTGG